MTERCACRVLDQPRTMQLFQLIVADNEELLRAAIVRLAGQYGRYGYRRVTALLHAEGWHVNHKRVERRYGWDTGNRRSSNTEHGLN